MEPTQPTPPVEPVQSAPAQQAPQPLQQAQPQPVPQTIITNVAPKKSKLKTIFVWLLFVLLLGGAGFLGYTYKMTNDKLKQQSTKLSESYKTIETFQAIINQDKATSEFIATYNNAALSRNLCGGNAVGMFDVHLADKYAVFRYLCANDSYPVRIGSMQKDSAGAYSFTYGSTPAKPNALPSYIYDSEPTFYGPVYGTTRF